MFLIKSKKDASEFINRFSTKFAADVWGEVAWNAFFFSTYTGNNVLIEKEDGFYDYCSRQNFHDAEPTKIDNISEYVWENRKFINNVFRARAKEYRQNERIFKSKYDR